MAPFHFTLTITNNSVENVTITALTDDNLLPVACTDLIGDVLTPGQSVGCTYDVTHTEVRKLREHGFCHR